MGNQHLKCRYEAPNGSLAYELVYFQDRDLDCGPDGKWNRDQYLNAGSNGTVYTCHRAGDRNWETHAVKFLHVLTPSRISRFEFECQVLSQLNHPGVLSLIGAGETWTSFRHCAIPFMITDRMDGNLQRRVANNGALDYKAVKRIGIQICDAFSHVHGAGIIHRDIKPANFLMRGDDIVVADFGLAKTATDDGEARFFREDITTGNEIVGPQAFMSPELYRYARDKSYVVDHRSDIYQIGANLWYLLTGFPPAGGLDSSDDPTDGDYDYIHVSYAAKQTP